MSLDAWGHIGYILIFAGMYLLGQKAKVGWVSRCLGDAVWVVVGFAMGMTSIWAWGLVFMANDVLSYRKWSIIGTPEEKREVVALILTTGDNLETIAQALAKEKGLSSEEKADLMTQVVDSIKRRKK